MRPSSYAYLKSGCRAEEARLETAERLAKFVALIAVVSWRIFFVTMSARVKPDCRFRRFTGRHSDQKPDAIPRIDRTRFRLKTGQF